MSIEDKKTKTVILHIGMPKTGSTAIQHFLMKNRDALLKLGLDYTLVGLYTKDCAHHTLGHVWGGWIKESELLECPIAAWDSLAESIQNSDCNTILISTERFGEVFSKPDGWNKMNFVKEKLDGFNIKVLFYVRRQDKMLESIYRQRLKTKFFNKTIYQFITDMILFELDFWALAERCTRHFGDDSVIARIYDKNNFYGGNLFSDFLNLCGIEYTTDMTIPDTGKNLSLGAISSKLISSPDNKNLINISGFSNMACEIFDVDNYKNDNNKSLLSLLERREIIELYKDNNQRFLSKYIKNNSSNGLAFEIEDCLKQFDVTNKCISYKDLQQILAFISKSIARNG